MQLISCQSHLIDLQSIENCNGILEKKAQFSDQFFFLRKTRAILKFITWQVSFYCKCLNVLKKRIFYFRLIFHHEFVAFFLLQFCFCLRKRTKKKLNNKR